MEKRLLMSTSVLGIHINKNKLTIVQVNRIVSKVLITKVVRATLSDNADRYEIIDTIKKIISSNDFVTNDCIFSFPEADGYSMYLKLTDNIQDKDIIQLGLDNLLGLEDTSSFKIIADQLTFLSPRYAQLIAVRSKVLNDIYGIGIAVGLNVLGLEIESQAKARCFIDGSYTDGVMFLTLGQFYSTVSIYDIYGLKFSTLLPFTGEKIDKKIMKKLDYNYDKAYAIKRKLGLNNKTQSGKVIHSIIRSDLNKTAPEIKIAIQDYMSNSEIKLKKVILDGEVNELPGVLSYFRKKLKEYEVSMGSVWTSVSDGITVQPSDSIAIGLALKGLNFHGSLNIFNFIEVIDTRKKNILERLFNRPVKTINYKVHNIFRPKHGVITGNTESQSALDGSILTKNKFSSMSNDIAEHSKKSNAISQPVSRISKDIDGYNSIKLYKPTNTEAKLVVPKDGLSSSSSPLKQKSRKSNNNNNNSDSEIEALKAVDLGELRKQISAHIGVPIKPKGLVRGNPKIIKKSSNKSASKYIKQVNQKKNIEIKKNKLKKNLGIRKKILIFLIIPSIFLMVFYLLSTVIRHGPRDINYSKHYKFSISDLSSAPFSVKSISGEFGLKTKLILGDETVIVAKLNSIIKGITLKDLQYNLPEGFIGLDKLVDRSLVTFSDNSSFLDYTIKSTVILVDRNSVFNIVSTDLLPQLSQKNLLNYEIDRSHSHIILIFDEITQSVSVRINGKLIRTN